MTDIVHGMDANNMAEVHGYNSVLRVTDSPDVPDGEDDALTLMMI